MSPCGPVHFAWSGGNKPETTFGYRVIGDNFVIALGSVDARPRSRAFDAVYRFSG